MNWKYSEICNDRLRRESYNGLVFLIRALPEGVKGFTHLIGFILGQQRPQFGRHSLHLHLGLTQAAAVVYDPVGPFCFEERIHLHSNYHLHVRRPYHIPVDHALHGEIRICGHTDDVIENSRPAALKQQRYFGNLQGLGTALIFRFQELEPDQRMQDRLQRATYVLVSKYCRSQ